MIDEEFKRLMDDFWGHYGSVLLTPTQYYHLITRLAVRVRVPDATKEPKSGK